jgi:hypothetical protein
MTLAMLWANKYVRYAAAIAGVIALLFVAAKYYEHVGSERGRQDVGQEIAKAIEDSRKADRQEFEKRAAVWDAQIAAAQQQAQVAQQLGIQLASQRTAATKQVAGMSDADVLAALKRSGVDLSAPAAQREFLQCKTQLPICEEQVAAAKNESTQNAATAQSWQGKFGDLDRYDSELYAHYVELWNVKATKVRSWKCLKMWRCSRPQISAPSPEEVQRPKLGGS